MKAESALVLLIDVWIKSVGLSPFRKALVRLSTRRSSVCDAIIDDPVQRNRRTRLINKSVWNDCNEFYCLVRFI